MVKLVRPVPSLDYAGRRLPELAGDMEQGVRDGVRILTDYAHTLGWDAGTLADALVNHLPLTPPAAPLRSTAAEARLRDF